MWQLKLAFFVALALMVSEARPSHHFDHHFEPHFQHLESLHGHVDHLDYAEPLLESFAAPAPVWPAPAPAPLAPAPAPLYGPAPLTPAPAPVYAPAPVLPAPAPAPLWAPAPAPLLPAALPAPLWPAPAALAPAPLPALLPAPAPVLPAAIPCPPATHTHVLPTTEVHLPTVTQLLPPVLESVPFTSSYRAIPGLKTTSHRVSLGYAFPKLVAAPHAHLRALPLKLAHHHHHHHSLF